jgi:hypothetical protein
MIDLIVPNQRAFELVEYDVRRLSTSLFALA